MHLGGLGISQTIGFLLTRVVYVRQLRARPWLERTEQPPFKASAVKMRSWNEICIASPVEKKSFLRGRAKLPWWKRRRGCPSFHHLFPERCYKELMRIRDKSWEKLRKDYSAIMDYFAKLSHCFKTHYSQNAILLIAIIIYSKLISLRDRPYR